MPPKSAASGRSGTNRPNNNEEGKEEPLRAVIVADTFETKFAPFTLERPRCLLPLANVPLIEYTLEYLASAGVREIYVYAGAHVDQVENYIDTSKWKTNSSPFKKFAFLRCQAGSVGDVMRDLDQKALMGANGDFIVVSGDVVSDFPIEKAMRKHRERREKDKNAIMTMILRERGAQRVVVDKEEMVATFVIDPTKDRCLHYEESKAGVDFGTHIEAEILKTPELDVRQDLIDCRIDICTPDVLSLWSDNFDNQSPRKDFLFGVLKDFELNGKTIHTYIVRDHYANRAGDLRSYAEITRDLQHSLSADLALENNISGTKLKRRRNGVLLEDKVIQARPSRLESCTIVGEESSIGKGGRVRNSVLGQRCTIGKNADINSAYIWDDTTVGSNVKISRAIIASEVFIGDGCTVGHGALISFGVKIAPGTHVPAGARITKFDQGESKDSDVVGGEHGEGWQYEEDEEDEEGPRVFGIYQSPDLNDSVSTLGSDISPPSSRSGSRSQSFATTMSDEEPTDRFQHDTVAILVQRMQETTGVDDMLSELMGLRFSGGADETQVRKAVATALMKHIHAQTAGGTVSAADASRTTLKQYHTLIRREQAAQTADEQVSFLLSIQRDLVHRSDGGRILLFVTKDLYDLEVLSEDAFTQWWADPRSSDTPEMAEVRGQTAQFIEWLENAESESEEDEDEDDDE